MTKLNNTEETNFEEINNTDELNIDSYEEEQNEDIEGEVEEQKEEVSVNKGNNLKKELAIQNRVLKREGYTKVEGKWVKTKQDNTESTNALSREEGKLYSKIFNSQDIPSEFEDDAVDKVIQIAKIEGTSLDEAYKSSYFKTWKETKLQEDKNKKAQLGVSRGSTAKQKKTLQSSGLTDAERKALWKAQQ